jgi:hypothetical protein
MLEVIVFREFWILDFGLKLTLKSKKDSKLFYKWSSKGEFSIFKLLL